MEDVKRITDEELNDIKVTVLELLEDAKQTVLADFYIPEKQEDIIECVLSMMAVNLLYISALRQALYSDYPKLKELIKLHKEKDIDNLFDLAIMLEDKYGATGSNREREVRELAEKMIKLLNYDIPNRNK